MEVHFTSTAKGPVVARSPVQAPCNGKVLRTSTRIIGHTAGRAGRVSIRAGRVKIYVSQYRTSTVSSYMDTVRYCNQAVMWWIFPLLFLCTFPIYSM